MPLATLPMYDRPGLHEAHRALWAAIRDGLRARGIDAPDALTQSAPDLVKLWTSPDLVLGQTCGLPFANVLKDRVTLVGAGDHRLPNVPAGHYDSAVILRAGEKLADTTRFAINAKDSQSGHRALVLHLAKAGRVLPAPLITGSHANSVAAVASGEADCAAIDAVTWLHLQALHSDAAKLHVIARTAAAPALPFITARDRDPVPIADALREAIAAVPQEVRDALHLHGLVPVTEADYAPMAAPFS